MLAKGVNLFIVDKTWFEQEKEVVLNATHEFTFGLVHGAWHGAWCWKPLQDELEQAGYRSISMDLPIENPDATFNDYAGTVTDALKNEDEVILVGHSRAGNVIPRATGELAVRKMIFLCSSFDYATIGRPTDDEVDRIPPRNGEGFNDGIVRLDKEMTSFDLRLASDLFYHDCPEELQKWAVTQLRKQRRSEAEPQLETWPDIDAEYVTCMNDKVVNPAWSNHVAKNWLGIEPIEFASGHSPFLSRPAELAKLLIGLAHSNQNRQLQV